MSRKRLVVTIGGTALCALAIGYLMQNAAGSGAAAPALTQAATRLAQPQQAVIAPAPAEIADENPALELDAIAYTSAQPDIRPPRPLSVPALDRVDGRGMRARAAADCPVTATARPAPKASVVLVVEAPCDRNARVTIHHNGMMFTQTTDALGQMNVTVPALAGNAVFIVAFANGKGSVAITQVPTLDDYDRVVLQWSGDSGFQMHAREFGATYGENGHVWSGVEGSALDAEQMGRGIVTRLGDAGLLAPRLAEIYTFPTGKTDKTGTVLLSVETEVTAANCGKDIAAQSLELRGDNTLRTRDLVLSVPNCSAVGDFLVLNNLVDNLKIAAR